MIMILTFVIVFFTFALLRVPVCFSISLGAIAGYIVSGINMKIIPPALLNGLDSFPLLAIPAFIFAGELMSSGGISSAIMNFVHSLTNRFRGSLGTVLVGSSMLFGSITGSSLATVTAIGGIMLPEMKKAGYNKRYSTALLAASGFLGILIPPSVPGVIYALMSEQKVTEVWMSTLLPGVLLGIFFMVVNYFVYGRRQKKITEPFRLRLFASGVHKAAPKAIVAFIMPVIIFGGVYSGVFTATEAGAVSVFYGLLAGWVIYPLFFKTKADVSLSKTIRNSAVNSAAIALLIASAALVGRMVALGGVTKQLIDFLMAITTSKYVFILVINVIFFIIGMLLETCTSIVLFTPILVPIATAYGIDPVHFGAIMLLNLEIGLITPPFAANLFVACRMSNTTMDEIIKPLLPFYGVCLPVLLIVSYIPAIVLWLPGLTG